MLRQVLIAIILIAGISVQSNADNNIRSEKDVFEVQIHPNPATDYIVIKANQKLDKLQIINLLGEEVILLENPALNERIELIAIPTNIYLIIATVDNVRRVSRLVVK